MSKAHRFRGRGAGGGLTLWSNLGIGPSEAVEIASGQTVYLDEVSACGNLSIVGELKPLSLPGLNVGLTLGRLAVQSGGHFAFGAAGSPFTQRADFVFNGAEVGRTVRTVGGTPLGFTNDQLGRSLQVMPGGKLSLFGVAPTVYRTKLNAHASAGTNHFVLADLVDWEIGDRIAISPTDWFGIAATEEFTITNIATVGGHSEIDTLEVLAADRWGVLQYPINASPGISLTPGTFTPYAGTPTVFDARARVFHLSRNMTFKGADDAAWAANQFGLHCMFMGLTSEIKIDGVELERVGQAGANGCYPIHWHMNSFNMPDGMTSPSDGTFLGVKSTDYIKNSSIHDSGQRWVVVHGTHGILVDRNVGCGIKGHALFLEDGSELNNTISNNVVYKIREPVASNRLLGHDRALIVGGNPVGTAAFWIAHPYNTVTGNWGGDSDGCGIWNSFAQSLFNLSASITGIVPRTSQILLQENNEMHSNQAVNMAVSFSNSNAQGVLTDSAYQPTNPFTITGFVGFKGHKGNYNNRVKNPDYQRWTQFDNEEQGFFGQVTDVRFAELHLMARETFNNANSRAVSSKAAAVASYHELLSFRKSTIIGYSWIDGDQPGGDANATEVGGGFVRLNDLYTQPHFTFSGFTDLQLIDCGTPFRALPPQLDGHAINGRHWTLAGSIHDINGVFGIPAGRTWIYDHAFLTHDAADLTDVGPAGRDGKHTTSTYYGVANLYTDFVQVGGSEFDFRQALTAYRDDPPGTDVGEWIVPSGVTGSNGLLRNMRHFSVQKDGIYRLTFPGNLATTLVAFRLQAFGGGADRVMIGVEFDGAHTITSVQYAANQFASGSPNYVPSAGQLSAGSACSLNNSGMTGVADILADTTGRKYWQDTANDLVWFWVNGDLTGQTPGVYRSYYVAVKAA